MFRLRRHPQSLAAFRSVRYASALSSSRIIATIAHIDAGKTTATERILYYTGGIRRCGDVDSGSTTTDHLAQERERGITIASAAVAIKHRDCTIHLVDTPGHCDFGFEVERTVRVIDGAVTIVHAVHGVQAQTEKVWAQSLRYGVKSHIVFVNKMDRADGARFGGVCSEIASKLRTTPLVVQIPVYCNLNSGDGGLFCGIVDLVNMNYLYFDPNTQGASITTVPLSSVEALSTQLPSDVDPSRVIERATAARSALVETLAELDDSLMDIFLSENGANGDPMSVSVSDVKSALRRCTISGSGVPVLCGSALKYTGVQPLIDAVIDYLPSPADVKPAVAILPNGKTAPLSETVSGSSSKSAPIKLDKHLNALAFKVVVDPQRGPMTFVRVYSGELNSKNTLVNTANANRERALRLIQMQGERTEEIQSIPAGSIGVVLGLKATKTGDTLVSADHPFTPAATTAKKQKQQSQSQSQAQNSPGKHYQLHSVNIPDHVFSVSIEAHSPSDEPYLHECLQRMMLEDPSLHLMVDEETGQLLLGGMGELHLEIAREKLVTELKAKATMGVPRIAYRECVHGSGSSAAVWDREIAGKAGKFGVTAHIEPIEPESVGASSSVAVELDLPEELPAEFADFDRQVIEDGLRNGALAMLQRGTGTGLSMSHVRVKLSDVKLFSPDLTTAGALRGAAAQATKAAALQAGISILEPVMRVQVRCKSDTVGTVMADLSGTRRGHIIGMSDDVDTDEGGQQRQSSMSFPAHIYDGNTTSTSSSHQNKQQERVGDSTIDVHVPLASMLGYASALRSLTSGTAEFNMELYEHRQMDSHAQKQLLKELRGY
ncbi:P-loop containing nucleoside triphosphate hydrolase protein [Ramicandelaber brevisporus]|nr:P-loop containing nucleoside triphosphate hydrolase protein [Ramicandelaber brevisporus]